ncbi:MAG: DUF937 domain-containing protein [Ideonella sp.]|nr:DUF937 domain-containing protein [Ideonella sp.]
MGLLDSVVGALAGGQGSGGGGGQAALISAVLAMLSQNGSAGGGLGALVEKFQQGGLGDVVGSWISTGQNLPVSPNQLENVLGSDLLGQLAGQLGLSTGDASAQLAQWLPQAVDQLTPNGRLPEAGGLGDIGAILGRFG